MEVSEKYRTPVIVRLTTRVSHSRGMVRLSERKESGREIGFKKDPPRHVPIPIWGRKMRAGMEDRLERLSEAASASEVNRIETGDRSLGIVTSSASYQYVKEVWPEASVLKLGFSYPFPERLIRKFASGVERLLVVEELDDILEKHIKSMGIHCEGKRYVPRVGELSPTALMESREMMDGTTAFTSRRRRRADDLPSRPPVLCPGCTHRGIFYALSKHDVVVTGDIGCYSLGVFKPLDRIDVILCMGGGVSVAHGFDKAGEPKKVVGIVGDSTFFHSGITGLLEIAYNQGTSTIIVADNRTTAMTGHQDHPGTGQTLMGDMSVEISVLDIGRACGFRRVREVYPYDLKRTMEVLKEELEAEEPSLIVTRAPCPLRCRTRLGAVHTIDHELCKDCGLCLKLGCPAIEGGEGKPTISSYLCIGCGLCRQVCSFEAISAGEEE
jgi:indolepyruvate ferredoxin oxidoreductase alpha subunit